MKCSVFIATSLDGFISRRDGSIDWLNEANKVVPMGQDLGYAPFFSSVDALVIGKNTFQQSLSFAEWPYSSTPVFVLSRHNLDLKGNVPYTVTITAEEPQKLIQRLTLQGFKHLYIDGGLTIQSFLKVGLIDEITITVIPILLGSGKPLFGALPHDTHLAHVSTQAFEFGFVQSKYRVINDSKE